MSISPSRKSGIILKKMNFEMSPLIVWIALWKVNTFCEFQVNIFSNNRDVTKYQFLHADDDADDDDKAIVIPRIFLRKQPS